MKNLPINRKTEKNKSLKLTDIGEFGFIARFSPAFLADLPKKLKGIGDDCAVIPWKDHRHLLVTTDLLVDGVHFLKDKITAEDLGYKSLAVNLSDIAAMGGRPLFAFLSLAIPPETELTYLDGFFRGWHELSRQTGVHLLGGDTTRSLEKLVINVAVLGEARTPFIKYRSEARAGDIIAVTGPLGDSEGGLRLILSGLTEKKLAAEEKYLLRRHFRPQPHLEEGQFLARQPEVRAMMDVSDGLDSDLRRIMEQSDCGVEVKLEKLPVSKQLRVCSQKYGWNLEEMAAAGGEDYCLLVTVAPEKFLALKRKFHQRFKRPLTDIGLITSRKGEKIYLRDGQRVELKKSGFDHFKT
ncbi:MAG: thiamine-phosphate kinase [Candidatus Aminicenantes bacterium]|nr:thiamine-phosphate kinase [Candidatus Aminicenantes bacterium]